MALEDLTPAVRMEGILDGADITPATRLEYFLSKAANEVPKPTGLSDAGKVLTVNEDGDGFILDEVDPGLPDIAGVSDAGKVVSVNAAGSAYELTTPPSGGGGAPLVQYFDGQMNYKGGGTERVSPSIFRLACDLDGNNNLTMTVMIVSHETYVALSADYCIANLPGPDMNFPIAKPDIFVKNDISPYSMTIAPPTSAFGSGRWVEPAATLTVTEFYYNPNIVKIGQSSGSPCLIMDVNDLVLNEYIS